MFKQPNQSQLKTIQVGVWITDRSKTRWQQYNVGGEISHKPKIGETGEEHLVKIPGTLRVGYDNNYNTRLLGKWTYWGYILRSKLTFDLTPIKGKWVTKAVLEFTKHHTYNENVTQGNCFKALHRLTGPWGDFFIVSVDFMGLLQGNNTMTHDITTDVNNWNNGVQEQHGLLITGWEEGFVHNNNSCVSWYYPKLTVTYIDKN